MADNETKTGTVKWYNPLKGYGFISPADGGDDVFLHASSLPKGTKLLDEGDVVEFKVEVGPKGPQALSVKIVKKGEARPRAKGRADKKPGPAPEPPPKSPHLEVRKLSRCNPQGFYDIQIEVRNEAGELASGIVKIHSELETQTESGPKTTNIGLLPDGQWFGSLRLAGDPPPRFATISFSLLGEAGRIIATTRVLFLSPKFRNNENGD